jgi:tRNA dimethylallyltransferase
MCVNSLPPIICLTGPTATGKSQLAIDLVNTLNCEIISVDSAMVYRGLDIGTAKPEPAILEKIPHHLINVRDPSQPYSAGDFFRDAQTHIQNIIHQDRTPLLVGGTMLYFYTLRKGLANLPHYTDHADYFRIRKEIENTDLADLYIQLQQFDPQAAQRIHAHDTQRIQRAIMVYKLTGQALTELQKNTQNTLPYRIIWIALYPQNRSELKIHIAHRFDSMLKEGFIDEVKRLYDRHELNADLPACRSVGYKQIWQYLAGELDYATMKEKSIIATCQLAKRQMTWLRKWPELKIFEMNEPDLFQKVKTYISTQIH